MVDKHFSREGKAACGEEIKNFFLTDFLTDCASYVNCEKCKEILLKELPNGPWELFANQRKSGEFCHIGHEFYAKMHGDDVYEVLVEIDENGQYWGWQDLDDNEPVMIWPNETLFKMCFPYGYQMLVEQKRGRALRLNIKEHKHA